MRNRNSFTFCHQMSPQRTKYSKSTLLVSNATIELNQKDIIPVKYSLLPRLQLIMSFCFKQVFTGIRTGLLEQTVNVEEQATILNENEIKIISKSSPFLTITASHSRRFKCDRFDCFTHDITENEFAVGQISVRRFSRWTTESASMNLHQATRKSRPRLVEI